MSAFSRNLVRITPERCPLCAGTGVRFPPDYAPGRRRVRGIAAQSIFVTLLLMAGNFRKITAFRQMVADGAAPKVAERARRRRVSLADYRSPP